MARLGVVAAKNSCLERIFTKIPTGQTAYRVGANFVSDLNDGPGRAVGISLAHRFTVNW